MSNARNRDLRWINEIGFSPHLSADNLAFLGGSVAWLFSISDAFEVAMRFRMSAAQTYWAVASLPIIPSEWGGCFSLMKIQHWCWHLLQLITIDFKLFKRYVIVFLLFVLFQLLFHVKEASCGQLFDLVQWVCRFEIILIV